MWTSIVSRSVKSIALVLAAAAYAGPAMAAFPEQPIRIIVPFAPGGGTDLVARTIGAGMSKNLGQAVIVENKPGAGTMIGEDFVAKSKPDGYTLVISTFAHAVNPTLQPSLPYGSNKAFAPVMLIARGPNVLVVRADSPFKTIGDLIADAKAHPGKLTYASQGTGTSAHLAGTLFADLIKTKITHIPYRGAGPALADLMGGQVDMMFATAEAAGPLVGSGKLRALGVTTTTPSPAFKGVPSISTSVPGYAVESWYGIYAPAGTPAAVIDRLNAAARKAVQDPMFASMAKHEGLTVSAGTPAELESYVRAEEDRWGRVIKQNNIKPE